MRKYRICKNKHGYYIAQRFKPPFFIWGTGTWENYGWIPCHYFGGDSFGAKSAYRFDKKKDVEDIINDYKETEKRNNNEFECDGEL